jgi:hypothetical protein
MSLDSPVSKQIRYLCDEAYHRFDGERVDIDSVYRVADAIRHALLDGPLAPEFHPDPEGQRREADFIAICYVMGRLAERMGVVQE